MEKIEGVKHSRVGTIEGETIEGRKHWRKKQFKVNIINDSNN